MAISFADAFAQAYGQGMQRRWLQEQEEAERKRQNEGAKAVLELINSMGRQQANADASSGLNQAVSGFNALNPDKGAPDFAFQTPDLTQRPGGNWQSPTGSSSLAGLAQSTFGGTQPQSGSLVSLMPKVEAPKYDDASMYGTMAKALGQDVDYSLAASIIPGYFTKQKSERLKNGFNSIVDHFVKENPNATDKDAYLWALKQQNAGYGIDPERFAALYKAKKVQAVNPAGGRREMIDAIMPESYRIGISPAQREPLNHGSLGLQQAREGGAGLSRAEDVSYGGGTVDYYDGINKATALITSGKYTRQQIEDAIRADYGDLAPYIIRDISGAFVTPQRQQLPPVGLSWKIGM